MRERGPSLHKLWINGVVALVSIERPPRHHICLVTRVGVSIMPKKKGYLKGKKSREAQGAGETVASLLEKGYDELARIEPEAALAIFQKAHILDPNDTNPMDAMADVLLQMGEQEEAMGWLVQSTTLSPTSHPVKWLNLAQLQSGKEALQSYSNGIQLLKQDLDKLSAQTDITARTVLQKQLAKVHSSVAELYLTDLCYEENAEQQCDHFITEALSFDSDCLDALNAMASLRLSQNRMHDACDVIETVSQSICNIRNTIAKRSIIEDLQNATLDDTMDIPSTDLCIATVKLLLECAVVRSSFTRHAADLVASLLQDDHDNVELWYLAGIAEMGSESDPSTCHYEEASYYFTQAIAMIEDIRTQYTQQCEIENIPLTDRLIPFEEEYNLLQSHQQIIRDKTQEVSGSSSGQADALLSVIQPQAGDAEEWSDDDENSEDDGEGDETRGALPTTGEMDES